MAVPEAYRRSGGVVGPAMYTSTDDPRAILVSLQRRYGTRIPAEKEEASLEWGAPWNLATPIKSMFFNIE